MRIELPYHSGERAVQARLGETLEAERNGRAIADSIVRGAFRFIGEQPLVVAGTVGAPISRTDGPDDSFASLIVGEPGFAHVSNEREIVFDLQRAAVHPDDPILANLAKDPRLGLLFIEPGSRRRLRVNGAAALEQDRLTLAVAEAYPNCPKYIQRRHLATRVDLSASTASIATDGSTLGPRELALISAADTFFVASANPSGGADASHRGGPPGFVRVLDERTLEVPDYPGNHMYNTLGNFVERSRAGVTFLDFATGRTLMLTGDVEIRWSDEGREQETGGTNRFWRFTVSGWRSFELPVKLEWELLDASPFNPTRR